LTRSTKHQRGTYSKQDLLQLIGRYPDGIGKREINLAFSKGTKIRNLLNIELKELLNERLITLSQGGLYIKPRTLPRVTVIEVTGSDENGDVLSKPLNWQEYQELPLIYVNSSNRIHSALGPGDHLLAELTRHDDGTYNAVVIRPLENKPKTILGIFGENGCIQPVIRGKRHEYRVAPNDTQNAEVGELVVGEVVSSRKLGRQKAVIIERLGKEGGAHTFSHIAIHLHDIPFRFPEETLKQAAACVQATQENRTDLRTLPLVTIDGETARDFDDAVFAEPWQEMKNGWHIVVAIADVAWYVRPETSLDIEARKRGNSVYFPDKVVPMLPESLSNGWCSLKPDEDRPCLAAHIWIDGKGNIIRHQFERAVIRSQARLTYTQVQSARDGSPDTQTEVLMDLVINPLFNAYDCLSAARSRREPLELNVPEADIKLDIRGNVEDITARPILDSHKLIEEFMIAANVSAAKALEEKRCSLLYRVHDDPPKDKLLAFQNFSGSLGLKISKSQILKPSHFNKFIEHAAKMGIASAIGSAVLRAQSKAHYTNENHGHFGLALRHYCHFTSPIRRYADLLIHRTLISTLNLGDGGCLTDQIELRQIGDHLSITELRAVHAERDTIDRFSAAFFIRKIGQQMTGVISGVAKFGLFVSLDGFASEGLVPIRSLHNEYFHFNESQQSLKGQKTGNVLQVGDSVNVLIESANPINRSITLKLVDYPNNKSVDRHRTHKFKKRKR